MRHVCTRAYVLSRDVSVEHLFKTVHSREGQLGNYFRVA